MTNINKLKFNIIKIYELIRLAYISILIIFNFKLSFCILIFTF